ncbi:Carboxymethylenebutenolidase [Thalassoporum mexicanum PCC 7367]|uniref:dienelactone hydrolase family protein n=1 Tax=Thalassoporum mexicanum TaxID=3457544 RepID=UPI00029FC787|nr:dienelactone hydrolase family protein [Pseudanabaena sp. PCC 7367]AFY70526.1 Carboxymethylenebutenolidase [Pseudanabaena sp. PCC 7367]
MKKITRRNFMIASGLTAGFALAAQPISAQAIATDTTDLTVGVVNIPVVDGEIPAYRAMPAAAENSAMQLPTILVVQEIFGVHAYIQDVCRRFAKLGYLAIAPDMYARYGDPTQLSSIDEIRQIVRQVPDAEVMADLDATVAWAIESSNGDPDQLGITGFCWGGRVVWLYAAHNPNLKAGVAWYGRLVGESSPRTPTHPLEVVTELNAPILGLYGENDRLIPLETVAKMREAIAESAEPASQCQIIVYPDAPHGFHADYRDSYQPVAARDGWQRAQDWFKQNGVG